MSSTVGVNVKRILDPLETIGRRGFSRYDVFHDWIDLMLSVLQHDDDAYLDTLDRYDRDGDRDRGKRVSDLFATAFSELMATIDETGQDVLGVAYEEFGMQTDAFGQQFTPHNVAATMAEIQTATDENGTQEDPVMIADPACGSGRMLVLAARQQDAPAVGWLFARVTCVRPRPGRMDADHGTTPPTRLRRRCSLQLGRTLAGAGDPADRRIGGAGPRR